MEAVLPLTRRKIDISRRKAAALLAILGLVVLLGGARLYLPYWLTDYVNRQIATLKNYQGGVRDIDVHLWRGAYQIHDLQLYKVRGGIREPFVDINSTDLSLDWSALFHGAIVAEIDMKGATLNFSKTQTGAGEGWGKFIDSLIPMDVNRLDIRGGRIAYIDHNANPDVNVYIDSINAHITNLQNVTEDKVLLPSSLEVSGNSVGGGRLRIDGHVNILKDVPDFDLDTRLENASLPAFNDYAHEFAAVDFKRGTIGIYSELAAANNRVIGYVKFLATDVDVGGLENHNPLSALWQGLVSLFIEIFKNQPRDQFAFIVPIDGRLDNPDKDAWAAFFSVFRNAFGQAFTRDTEGRVDIHDLMRSSLPESKEEAK